jgi:protein involved in polysaccharide export with SLBB domain
MCLFALALSGCGPRQISVADDELITAAHIEHRPAHKGECLDGWTPDLLSSYSTKDTYATRDLLRARPRHAAGDVVKLDVPEGDEFSGVYRVNLDGYITVPYAGAIRAAGLTTDALNDHAKQVFIQKGLLLAERASLSIIPVEWAPIQVRVSGAVFQPGRGLINNSDTPEIEKVTSFGDRPPGRFLDAGIRIAAGARPDADLSTVIIHRRGTTYNVDLSGVIDGQPVPDVYLMHDDHIEILSTGCSQEALVRPSQITPAGIRIFISNTSVPVGNNSVNIQNYATNVPYGTRLLAASTSANCVGGTYLTNEARSVAHVAFNPVTGKATVREYPVRDMMAYPNSIAANPYVMPNDAIACYDSVTTSLSDAVSVLNQILATAGIAATLF